MGVEQGLLALFAAAYTWTLSKRKLQWKIKCAHCIVRNCTNYYVKFYGSRPFSRSVFFVSGIFCVQTLPKREQHFFICVHTLKMKSKWKAFQCKKGAGLKSKLLLCGEWDGQRENNPFSLSFCSLSPHAYFVMFWSVRHVCCFFACPLCSFLVAFFTIRQVIMLIT